MDVAKDIVKTMTAKKKGKSKSAKDKSRNLPKNAQVPLTVEHHSISGPALAVAGDGLYVKLTQHQKNIASQIKFIITELDNDHKDLSTVITNLLVQLSCVVTTTHQCLNREIYGKNDSLKPRLEYTEGQMYSKVAYLVRWVDLEWREHPKGSLGSKSNVRECIFGFELALADIVKLVAEAQALHMNSHPETLSRIRRTSVEPGVLQSLKGSGEMHPYLTALRNDQGRKASWSPGMAADPMSLKLSSLHYQSVFRDSTHSESSSTSDEERRRSGSNERQLSPERSSDWESRYRSHTAPIDLGSSGGDFHSSPIPVPIPTVPTSTTSQPLPPLPGEASSPPPPLPRRQDPALQPPLPPRRGHTLPRMSDSLHMNGRFSPEYPVHREEDQPPPLPMKKKHSVIPTRVTPVNGHTAQSVEETPPPVPVKQRRGKSSFSSPTHTPIRPSIDIHSPTDSYLSKSLDFNHTLEEGPRVPVRIESIPGLKGALVQETPPPKPPRTDWQPSSDAAVHTQSSLTPHSSRQNEVTSAILAVRKYNEDIMKRSTDPDSKPPVPLKKKTVMMYSLIVKGYTFDDTLTQPLYISKEEPPPPPLPPKKRKKKRPEPVYSEEGGVVGGDKEKQDTSLSSNFSASSEDVYNEEGDVDGEVNYLECEQSSGYLTFNREEGGGYTLRGGPVDALIAYAASTTTAVKHFSEAFLLTYYTFIKPEDLISKLLYRLDFFYKQHNAAVWTATTSLLVRVLTGLNQPLVKEAEVKLIDMVHQMLSDGNLKFAQLLRNSLVEKLKQLIPDRKSSIPLGRAMSSHTRKLPVLEFSADDIARQMTILDNELFQKVDVAEMLYWAAEQSEEKSPELTRFTMHFNNVSQWTKTRLLEKVMEMRTRIKLMLHFISIMKCLREHYNNFNSYLAILSAIESSPVSRLDWPDRVIKGLEDPRALIDNRGSFKNYREAFKHAKPPCIPYIGLYLQDLTFIEMQPSYLEDKTSINFTKRWKQFKSVDHIRFAQTKQYTGSTFDPDPDILGLFSNFENHSSDEELWVISNEIKPSARAQKLQQTTQ